MDYLLFLQEARQAAPDLVNRLFMLASDIMASPLPIFVGVIIFWCISKRGGYLVMSCYIACAAINQVAKNILCVYRPWILDSRIQPYEPALPTATGYSMPSGHTAISTGFFGGFVLWFKHRKGLVAVMVSCLLIVAFSRNWLGCHTLQDVLVSLVIATATMMTTSWVLRVVDRKPYYDIVASAIFLAASIGFMAFCYFKTYPVDYDAAGNILVNGKDMLKDCYESFGALFGISIAWPLERHFIKFSVEGSVKTRIVRALVGCVLIGSTYAFGSFVLQPVLGLGLGRYLKFALVVIMGVVVYPALFSWWEHRCSTKGAHNDN